MQNVFPIWKKPKYVKYYNTTNLLECFVLLCTDCEYGRKLIYEYYGLTFLLGTNYKRAYSRIINVNWHIFCQH